MKWRIHPLFFFYILLLVIMGQAENVFVYLFCVIAHEYGHSIVAKKLGYKLGYLKLMPYGVCLNYNTNCFYNNDEIYIAVSGPLVNFFLVISTMALWWVFPVSYGLTYTFCMANIVMVVFNLLPCYPLDGGRVLVGILCQKLDRKKAIKIAIIFNIIICIIFFCVFVFGLFNGIKNFNLIIISLFLFSGIIDPENASKYDFLQFNKKSQILSNKAIGVNHICINSFLPIYKILPKLSKNKFNIIYVAMQNSTIKTINENMLNIIIQKYSLDQNFSQIFEMIKNK